jgi:endoglucanase
MRNYVVKNALPRALFAICGGTTVALSLGSGCASVRHSSESQAPAAAPPAPVATNAMPAVPPGPGLSPAAAHNILANATFDGGKSLPWMTSFSVPADGKAAVVNGEYCVEVKNKGSNPWDAQFRHREMMIQKGHTYHVRFRARSSEPVSARSKVGQAGPPYAEYWHQEVDLTSSPQTFEYDFTMQGKDDPTAEFAFHIGGNMAKEAKGPYTICVDDIELDDPDFAKKEAVAAAPRRAVRVNQTGYLPGFEKIAAMQSDATSAQGWELIDGQRAVVAAGKTTVFGKDAASGDNVHLIDFSAFTKPGTGYKLRVGSEESDPFDIGANLYGKLKYQALAYFYHNRSGIEIALPYAGEKQWARAAGHLADKADKGVPCLPDSGCNYTLDVTGGWYDAGDHGKYVVNGGISVWTLLNQYERAKQFGGAADFGDGKLNIPESHNNTPDLLDEARWEIDFLLKMQVPEGQALAGMVHHKVHDKEWTALGLAPSDDKIPRFLHAPSTAATLNVAAVAAQAARVFKPFDAAFAAKCLTAAERAWKAAEAHPAVYAAASDASGGGAYDDKNVTDEFYWAAAELFITTGKAEYQEFVTKSPHFKTIPSSSSDGGNSTSFTWGDTQALGTISLALVPNKLPAADIAASRKAVVSAADGYVEIIQGQGYRLPFKPGAKNDYPWGSNSFVLNNAIVLALANDFAHDGKYLNAVAESMDYILGRNPLDQSYVTGYGERPLENPHHRFWAYQVDHRFPKAPPGIVSGGPNSGLQDPYVQAAGLAGCAPEKCFVDNMEAWSANEITINWNAPLAWVAAYLDDKGKATPAEGHGKGKAHEGQEKEPGKAHEPKKKP